MTMRWTSSAWRSIRTKFGLVTAAILLGLLLAFYLGGRFILVHMIREAEKEVQLICNDVKSVVYNELTQLQQTAVQAALRLHKTDKQEQDTAFLQGLLTPFATQEPIHLAAVLTREGAIQSGFFVLPGGKPEAFTAESIQPYIASVAAMPDASRNHQPVSGLIIFQRKPLFIALTPIDSENETPRAFLLVGAFFHNHPLLNRINEVTHGMQVAVSDHPVAKWSAPSDAALAQANVSPVFPATLNFYAGGKWHLGNNTFEAVLPVNDITGKEVSSISIRLPRTFSSLASIALGWLTVFVASVGIVFVLPIFWLQTRIVLNPLTALSNQIKGIGEHHQDGTCAYLQWPRKDEFGMVAQSINTLLDTLSRKTQHISQIEQRQRALIAGVPDCLCVFDVNSNLVAIHKQPDNVHPIPGLTPGHPISSSLFLEEDCEKLRTAITETFATEKIQKLSIACREQDGSLRHFETRISLMDAFFALVILRDVTHEWREREARQQVESRLAKIQKMESLGNLAASIAHDFNNILAIIQNTIDLTWTQPLENPEEDAAISTVRQAAGKGVVLTRELMTYAGQTRIVFKKDDPNTIILDLEKLIGGVIAPNISLELKLTPNLPKIETDPHQFWKVIINLLKNASESMNGARGHIRISTYQFEMTAENKDAFFSNQELIPGPGVMFQIDDTGSGIPREVIERLFEPFFSTKAVGRGLGLSTVFGIVGSHNGGIAIDSEPGKGSSFEVWIPAAKEQTDSDIRDHATEHRNASATNKNESMAPPQAAHHPLPPQPRVLMVEDDLAILQTTRILLKSLGVETLTAATKREALALFRRHADTIQLILLDAQIGKLDNVRLLSTLRMRKSGIPTVIVSGHIETRIREMFAAEPFNAFLSKPYTISDLKNVLTPFITLKNF